MKTTNKKQQTPKKKKKLTDKQKYIITAILMSILAITFFLTVLTIYGYQTYPELINK